jgi:hypothetical protein
MSRLDRSRSAFCGDGALLGFAHAVLQLLDRDGDAFEEIVDLVGVVTPHLLVEFDLVDHLRRDVHGRRW